MSGRERYPLSWPAGWKRSTVRQNAQFGVVERAGFGVDQRDRKKRVSIDTAFDRLERELRLFGVHLDTVIVSTNLKLTLRGMPAGNQGEPSDPGVAVYWTRKGKAECMAIDTYRRVADNLAAIAATLDGMRAIERHGGAQILDRAFIGFAALPERSGDRRPWREVMELGDTASGRLSFILTLSPAITIEWSSSILRGKMHVASSVDESSNKLPVGEIQRKECVFRLQSVETDSTIPWSKCVTLTAKPVISHLRPDSLLSYPSTHAPKG